MKKPNFFIIGAPKSATTALSQYLSNHPNVFFSNPKEPHFFNDDFSCRYTNSLDQYLSYFTGVKREHTAIGEGSVFYLYSKNAVPNILEMQPDARFIVMLRNPIEASYSWHWQAMYSFGENLTDFREAWRAQEIRQKGKKLPKANLVREALLYGPLFRYGEQMERLFSYVSRDRVHLIIFDDFKRDPGLEYQRVLNFLELPPFALRHYGVVNASKRYRSFFLEGAVRGGAIIRRILRLKKGWGILTRLRALNTRLEKRPPLERSFVTELRDYFRDDVERLSVVIDRDLKGWVSD